MLYVSSVLMECAILETVKFFKSQLVSEVWFMSTATYYSCDFWKTGESKVGRNEVILCVRYDESRVVCMNNVSFSWNNFLKAIGWAVFIHRLPNLADVNSSVKKESTWLILPVVIRLSQRLSHACLSINKFVLWNCEWLIISVIVYLIVPYYLDNRSNSRANTCINTRLFGRVAFIRLKPMQLVWYCVES